MRRLAPATWLLVAGGFLAFGALAFVACSPDIAPGAYLCGPNAACPGDYVCSGSDNTCEDSSTAMAYECDLGANKTPAAASPIDVGTACITTVSVSDCLAGSGDVDWYTLTTPAGCTTLAIHVEVDYPLAWEPLTVALADANGNVLATSSACSSGEGFSDAPGEDRTCLVMTAADATAYTLEIAPAGGDDCAGACAFNRYTLTTQLSVNN